MMVTACGHHPLLLILAITALAVSTAVEMNDNFVNELNTPK